MFIALFTPSHVIVASKMFALKYKQNKRIHPNRF